MRQWLWPVGVVAAFGVGLASSSLYPAPPSVSPSDAELRATIERLETQVSALQARVRGTESRTASPIAGRAAAPLESSPARTQWMAAQARSGQRAPASDPQDDLAAPTRPVRPAVVSATAVPATVDGALDRLYRYLTDGVTATGSSRWRQYRELTAELKAMGDVGTEALARVLANGTTSEERRTAAQLLGELGDPKALPLLQDVLDRDGDVLLRRSAASALRRLESPDTIPTLETILANSADDRYVRMSAAVGLARMGQPQGVAGLMQIFDEANADGRGRDVAFRALNALNDERSLPFMRQVASSSSELTYRMQAIKFLSAQGDRQSLPALAQIMQSPTEQPSIRDAAGQAYAAINGRR